MTNELVDTGASFSGMERNHLYLNQAGKDYVELSALSGLDSPSDARTHVRLDWNRDGFPDLALVNANAPFLQLFENQLAKTDNHFVAIRLHGGNTSSKPSPWSPRDGIGAQIRVRLADRVLLRELRAGEGFGGQNSNTLLIGLGHASTADSLEVRWPSGKTTQLQGLGAGQLVNIYENPEDSPTKKSTSFGIYASPKTTGALAKTSTKDQIAIKSKDASRLSIYVTMATWCHTCEQELTRLPTIIESLPKGTVAAFGIPIDPDDTRQKIKDWQIKRKAAVPLLANLTQAQLESVRALLRKRAAQPDAVPNTIVTDNQGNVRAVFPGAPTLSQIRALLDG